MITPQKHGMIPDREYATSNPYPFQPIKKARSELLAVVTSNILLGTQDGILRRFGHAELDHAFGGNCNRNNWPG
jgi:hypothetical protein